MSDEWGRTDIRPGTVVAERYVVEDKLGEGGMGQVYRAIQTSLRRPVALKVLSRELADDAGRRRFLREARVAAALRHPSAVEIYDVGHAGGVVYIAMELLGGTVLRDYMQQPEGRLPLAEALEITTQIAELLVTAHAVGIGLASGDAPPPRAAYDAGGTLVVTHPTWAGDASISGTVSWLAAVGGSVLATSPRVEPSLRLVTGPDSRVLTLGQTPGARESLLYLDSGLQLDPDEWQIIYVLPTVTSSSPALAVDDYGHAHVLARTAVGRPGHEDATALEVLRWSDEGNLVWKLSLPLALDLVSEPVSLALASDGDLVIAGFVAGARHVEKRGPGCNCG